VSVDQRGQPIDVDLGNGVSVIAGFDALTGLIDYKQSGTGGSTTNIQDLVYDWDDNGNLSERRDDRQSLTETFFYDSMHRLDYSELGGTQNLDLAYQDNGNILSKDDVSGSNYGYHASKVHAVTSAGTNSFEYDANGNAKKRNGHTITWTSYNKPSDINGSGGQDSRFWYAPDRSRWKQVATYTSGTETTIYVGGLLEKRTVGSVTEYQHLIPAPDGTRIHRVLRTDSTTDTFYLATDHLGSTDAILNATGGVEVYTSFDAFGQRRDPTDWDGPPSSSDLSKIADTTRRGYTGHEHLDNLGLIHMNGRVQDPLVGRFISADPYVQAPYLSQNLNRYTYGLNGPMSYTDPSGHRFFAIDPFGVGTIVAVVRFFQMLVGGDSFPASAGYRHGPGGSASGGHPGSSERAGVGWRGPRQDTAPSRGTVHQNQPDTHDGTISDGQPAVRSANDAYPSADTNFIAEYQRYLDRTGPAPYAPRTEYASGVDARESHQLGVGARNALRGGNFYGIPQDEFAVAAERVTALTITTISVNAAGAGAVRGIRELVKTSEGRAFVLAAAHMLDDGAQFAARIQGLPTPPPVPPVVTRILVPRPTLPPLPP